MKTMPTLCSSLLFYLFTATVLLGLPIAHLSAQAIEDWQLPRTVDDQPDLQGVWENNTITPVERPEVFGDKEFLTDEDVAFLRLRVAEITQQSGDALFGDGILAAAFSGEIQSGEITGNYDQQWMAQRTIHRRTSQIIDPPDGKYPPRTEQAVAMTNQSAQRRRDHPADSWLDRSLGERCVTFGAPRLGSGYNSYIQIVQAKDHVAIIQEMIHDTRIIPLMQRPHIDEDIKLWHGDARGWWEGDTLVIETSNYSDKSGGGPDAAKKVNLERLTRISESAIQYQFTSDDPGNFTAPYTREIILDKSPDAIYEYACHEGNYGMMNILSGHRAQERMEAANN